MPPSEVPLNHVCQERTVQSDLYAWTEFLAAPLFTLALCETLRSDLFTMQMAIGAHPTNPPLSPHPLPTG